MKKYIIAIIISLFILGVLIAFSVTRFQMCAQYYDNYISTKNEYSEMNYRLFINCLSYGILFLCSAILDIIAIVLFSMKDTTGFKPLVDKYNAHKQARQIAQTEKAEQQKQARIEKLQAELDELKKDE